MIERVIFAKSRADLVAATKALDRVLLWNDYVVPQWTYGKMRSARWDRFGRPETMPKYGMSAFSRRSGGGTPTRPPRREAIRDIFASHVAAFPSPWWSGERGGLREAAHNN